MWNSILYSCTIHLKLNFVNSTGKNWLYLIEIQLDKIMLLSNLSLKTRLQRNQGMNMGTGLALKLTNFNIQFPLLVADAITAHKVQGIRKKLESDSIN